MPHHSHAWAIYDPYQLFDKGSQLFLIFRIKKLLHSMAIQFLFCCYLGQLQ